MNDERERLQPSVPLIEVMARELGRLCYLWLRDERPAVRSDRPPAAAHFRIWPGGRIEWRPAREPEDPDGPLMAALDDWGAALLELHALKGGITTNLTDWSERHQRAMKAEDTAIEQLRTLVRERANAARREG